MESYRDLTRTQVEDYADLYDLNIESEENYREAAQALFAHLQSKKQTDHVPQQGYLVAWVNRNTDGDMADSDHYEPFIEDSSEENLKKATERYNHLIESTRVYSANLCTIVKSTDYDVPVVELPDPEVKL